LEGGRGPKITAGSGAAGSQSAGQEGSGQEGGELARFLDPAEFRQPGQEGSAGGHSWRELLDYWALVEADLHQFYGLNLWHPDSYRAIAWHYLKSRVEQLLAIPPTVIYQPTENGYRRVVMPATRIGLQLEPPDEGDGESKGR
jgi:hypothetical protein